MKISFRKSDDGFKNKIFLDNKLIGEVELNVWNQKWKMTPFFNFNPFEQAILYSEYESAYKAGKALVNLYTNSFLNEDDLDDTKEIDMRGVFRKRRRRGP